MAANKDGPESFEVQEYNEPDKRDPEKRFKIIKQIVQDNREQSVTTSYAFKVDLVGNEMKVQLSMYEMFLSQPQRLKEVEDIAHRGMNEYLTMLKREFKKKAKYALDPKELKDKADYSVQKVSLNQRFMYTSWRVYEI